MKLSKFKYYARSSFTLPCVVWIWKLARLLVKLNVAVKVRPLSLLLLLLPWCMHAGGHIKPTYVPSLPSPPIPIHYIGRLILCNISSLTSCTLSNSLHVCLSHKKVFSTGKITIRLLPIYRIYIEEDDCFLRLFKKFTYKKSQYSCLLIVSFCLAFSLSFSAGISVCSDSWLVKEGKKLIIRK